MMRLEDVEREINEIIRIIEEADDYKPHGDLVTLSYRLREEREKNEPKRDDGRDFRDGMFELDRIG